MRPDMFGAISKSVAQLGDPAFRGVALRALGVSIAVFVVLWFAAWFAFGWLGGLLSEWLISEDTGGFWRDLLEWLFGAASIAGVFLASFLLFPAVVAVAIGLFLDEIAAAVEAKHYPGLPTARNQPWSELIKDTLSFALITVAINLVALPLYLLLLFVPPLNLLVYYGVNGYLLGREYFELVAVRRLDARAAKDLRRRFRGTVFLAGVIIAFFLSIPIVNLIAPVIATAFLVHLYQRLQRRAAETA